MPRLSKPSVRPTRKQKNGRYGARSFSSKSLAERPPEAGLRELLARRLAGWERCDSPPNAAATLIVALDCGCFLASTHAIGP